MARESQEPGVFIFSVKLRENWKIRAKKALRPSTMEEKTQAVSEANAANERASEAETAAATAREEAQAAQKQAAEAVEQAPLLLLLLLLFCCGVFFVHLTQQLMQTELGAGEAETGG